MQATSQRDREAEASLKKCVLMTVLIIWGVMMYVIVQATERLLHLAIISMRCRT